MKQNDTTWLISGRAMADEDRRIRRTKRALAAALIELAAERAYEAITIREITERADVGYATFFRHFESKDELMLQIFQDMADDLEATAAKHGDNFFKNEGVLIFKHVQDNEVLYRTVLDSPPFARKLRAFFTAHIAKHMEQQARTIPEPVLPLPVAANHVATSLLGLVEWWLGQGLSLPVEQMAQIYDRLIIRATWYAIAGRYQIPLPWEADIL